MFKTFLAAYRDAIQFTEGYTDELLAPETLTRIQKDCRRFWDANHEHLSDNPSQGGHDFWLTRNRHGAGFWDGDWSEPAATILTNAAHGFGECELYVGDYNLIHTV